MHGADATLWPVYSFKFGKNIEDMQMTSTVSCSRPAKLRCVQQLHLLPTISPSDCEVL